MIEKYDKTGTPLAVLPVPEPSSLKMAQAVDIETERAECKKLHEEVTTVKNFAFKIDQTATEFNEPFISKMKIFMPKAEEEMKELQENLEDCSSKFVDCLKFYKFTPKKGKVEDAKPSDFFGAWYMFCEDFKKANGETDRGSQFRRLRGRSGQYGEVPPPGLHLHSQQHEHVSHAVGRDQHWPGPRLPADHHAAGQEEERQDHRRVGQGDPAEAPGSCH